MCLLVIKSGKQDLTDWMEQPSQDKIRMPRENETYKYMGILEAVPLVRYSRHFLKWIRKKLNGSKNVKTNDHTLGITSQRRRWQTVITPLPAVPNSISFLKPLMAIRSDRFVVSLISEQGHYAFRYGHTKHNWEGGGKE